MHHQFKLLAPLEAVVTLVCHTVVATKNGMSLNPTTVEETANGAGLEQLVSPHPPIGWF